MIFSSNYEPTLTPSLSCGCSIKVDLDALGHNYTVLNEYIHGINPKTKLSAVVKADAYGHGADVCIPYLYSIGCRNFCVANIAEAINARMLTADDAEILILGFTSPKAAPLLAKYGITQTLYSAEMALELAECARECGVNLDVHIKLDTGMHRLGFDASSSFECADEIMRICNACRDVLNFKGVFTHMAEPLARDVIDRQMQRYMQVCLALEDAGFAIGKIHTSASDAFMNAHGNAYDMLRIGVSLYGYGRTNFLDGTPRVRPMMTLELGIIQLHKVRDGEKVGYGGDYVAHGDREIATLSGGYADGVIRAYTGSQVRVRTADGIKLAKLCGRVCMDMCMADVTGLNARVGDRVIIFGDDDGSSLRALAKYAHTLEYECLCAVSRQRGKRIIVQNGVEREA